MKRDTFLPTGVKSIKARRIEDIEIKFYLLNYIMDRSILKNEIITEVKTDRLYRRLNKQSYSD
jgi:hypothetical protein